MNTYIIKNKHSKSLKLIIITKFNITEEKNVFLFSYSRSEYNIIRNGTAVIQINIKIISCNLPIKRINIFERKV